MGAGAGVAMGGVGVLATPPPPPPHAASSAVAPIAAPRNNQARAAIPVPPFRAASNPLRSRSVTSIGACKPERVARPGARPYSRPVPPELSHIDAWIFDLDNTLYPARVDLFAQIDRRMTAYIARLLDLDLVAARRLQKSWFHAHGTTLAGLMAEHGVDPHAFLADVHDIELDVLDHDAPLAAAVARLPGRKLVFTNGDVPYASRVLERLGLGESFEAIHDVHAMALRPKPAASAYRGLCDAHGIEPATALFVDDMTRNLAPAKAIGMTTVWVDNGSEQAPGGDGRAFIDYTVAELGPWLHAILEDA